MSESTNVESFTTTANTPVEGSIICSCDGACTRSYKGGWAFFDGTSYASGTIPGKSTNNVAEYTGLIKLLEHLLLKNITQKVTIMMDSQLVVYHISGQYTVRNEGLRPLYNRALALLSALDADVIWTPRSHPIMGQVDKLAKEATQ